MRGKGNLGRIKDIKDIKEVVLDRKLFKMCVFGTEY